MILKYKFLKKIHLKIIGNTTKKNKIRYFKGHDWHKSTFTANITFPTKSTICSTLYGIL